MLVKTTVQLWYIVLFYLCIVWYIIGKSVQKWNRSTGACILLKTHARLGNTAGVECWRRCFGPRTWCGHHTPTCHTITGYVTTLQHRQHTTLYSNALLNTGHMNNQEPIPYSTVLSNISISQIPNLWKPNFVNIYGVITQSVYSFYIRYIYYKIHTRIEPNLNQGIIINKI